MNSRLQSGKVFYGWVIVAASFILMGTVMGIVSNCASLFIKPICADLGFTRQQMGGISTLLSSSCMLVSLLWSALFARFNMRRLMQVASVVLCCVYYCYSLVSTLPLFYLIAMVSGVCFAVLTTLPLSMIVSNWFRAKRGLAIGIAFMGSGVGGMVFNPLCGLWIEAFGWRMTFRILTAVLVVCVLPCTFFLLQIRPEDIGLSPYGSGETGGHAPAGDEWGVTRREAMRMPSFWLFGLCTVCMGYAGNTLTQCIAPNLSDLGYSTAFAANTVAAAMGTLALGKLLLGELFDRFGPRPVSTFAASMVGLGLFGMLGARFLPAIGLLVLGNGLGNAMGSVGYPIVAQELFGKKHYGSVYGAIAAMGNIGGIVTPVINGTIYDTTGSYTASAIAGIVLVGVAILSYQLVFTLGKKARPQNKAEGAL